MARLEQFIKFVSPFTVFIPLDDAWSAVFFIIRTKCNSQLLLC